MSEWKIRFGTAGTSDSFTAMGYKNSLDIPAYTEKMGLDAFEYQCGHGSGWAWDKARQMLTMPPPGGFCSASTRLTISAPPAWTRKSG